MKKFYLITILFLIWFIACEQSKQAHDHPHEGDTISAASNVMSSYEHREDLVATIAFGSCGHQDLNQPVLSLAAAHQPDLFIFLGDNIYGDTYSMDTLQKKYDQLGAKPEFQKLRNTSRILATWDDHDYGWNDSGRHYPYKEESKQIFLDFWQVPQEDIRRQRPGIYTSYMFTDGTHRVQVIILDLRTFRDDLRRYRGEPMNKELYDYEFDYWPYEKADSTLMGEAQWKWLEQQFGMPAELRIIASSTQFGISANGYEAWANFPHEQQRMLDLIQRTKANGVLFVSGDVHYAEISRIKKDEMYPVYDVTASGITSTWGFATPNHNRIEGPVMENHFGLISINWQDNDPAVKLQIYDVRDSLRINHEIKLSQLNRWSSS
ncbi:MAG: alkaline phosphatase D family protein [Candidatus Cyclobacteriaceae bacterium M3_2C_046]